MGKLADLAKLATAQTTEQINNKILDILSFLESSNNTNPKRLKENSDGALGEFQLTRGLFTDIKRDFPEHRNVEFEDAALGPDRRKFAQLGLMSTGNNLASVGVAPTTDAVIQAYHSGPGNVASGNIGKDGKKYLKDFNRLFNR